MDLDDVLEAIGKILEIIGLSIVIFLGIAACAYCLLGWLFAVVAFIQGNIALGFGLLIVWLVVGGFRLRKGK